MLASTLDEVELHIKNTEPFIGRSAKAYIGNDMYYVYVGDKMIYAEVLNGINKGKYSFDWRPIWGKTTESIQEVIKRAKRIRTIADLERESMEKDMRSA